MQNQKPCSLRSQKAATLGRSARPPSRKQLRQGLQCVSRCKDYSRTRESASSAEYKKESLGLVSRCRQTSFSLAASLLVLLTPLAAPANTIPQPTTEASLWINQSGAEKMSSAFSWAWTFGHMDDHPTCICVSYTAKTDLSQLKSQKM